MFLTEMCKALLDKVDIDKSIINSGEGAKKMKPMNSITEIIQNNTDDIAMKIIDIECANNRRILNVEALCAGGEKNGFSIMAMEISNLAEQSNSSSTEIESTMKKIKTGIEQSKVMVTSTEKNIQDNMRNFEITKKDLIVMLSSQESSMDKILLLDRDINILENHIQKANDIIEETIFNFCKTSSDILDVSTILGELNKSFQIIDDFVKEV
jgi:methyl-accepting chemotaxis protein